MTDNVLSEYLTRAQSTIDGLKLMLVGDDLKKVLEKLDNMFMVFILHGLPKEYATVKDQALTNITIPTVEELIDRLTRVSSPSDDTQAIPESSTLISNSNDCGSGGRGRGQGRGRGRGGRGNGNLRCTYCKRDGHTQDRCYNLHGYPTSYPNKSANVAQSSTNS